MGTSDDSTSRSHNSSKRSSSDSKSRKSKRRRKDSQHHEDDGHHRRRSRHRDDGDHGGGGRRHRRRSSSRRSSDDHGSRSFSSSSEHRKRRRREERPKWERYRSKYNDELDMHGARGSRSTSTSGTSSTSSAKPSVDAKEALLAKKKQEQDALEEEMRKRRERIAAWRAEQSKKNAPDDGVTATATTTPTAITGSAAKGDEDAPSSSTWTLDDDDDDDEEEGTSATTTPHDDGKDESMDVEPSSGGDGGGGGGSSNTNGGGGDGDVDEDDVDPLDAYMQGLQTDLQREYGGGASTVVVVKESTSSPSVGAAGTSSSSSSSSSTKLGGGGKTRNSVRSKLGERLEVEDDFLENWKPPEEESILGKLKQRKDLPPVDHSTIDYISIRKDLYIEVPAIKNMTKAEVKEYRQQHLDKIRIHGRNCPNPIKEFSQCGLASKMYAVMKKCGYERPTPIQAQALPAIMKGRDIIGVAKTGSGKTLAFVIPMLRHILDQPELEPGEGPIGMIMAPTRELAMQIHKEVTRFAKPLGLRSVCVYGGSDVAHQISKLKAGAEVVVCTPGRMIDILCANSGRVCDLRRCSIIVMDEADRMFDMGFTPQVMRIVGNIRPDRQVALFSATFPRAVEEAAKRILQKPLLLIVGGRAAVNDDIEQHIEVMEEDNKFERLLSLLRLYKKKGQALIFVDTQDSVDSMYYELNRTGFPTLSLHGGHDQMDRDETVEMFKAGKKKVLVATSVAARGLDVPEIILVVNYDTPNHYEDYVHRVGRTGRAGKRGFAYTFLTPEEDQYAPDLVKGLMESKAGKEGKITVPARLQEMADGYLRKKAEGRAQGHSSGYGGKGFKFDEEEANKLHEFRLAEKIAAGEVQGSLRDAIDEAKKSKSEAESTTAAASASAGAASGTAGAAASSAGGGLASAPKDGALLTPQQVAKLAGQGHDPTKLALRLNTAEGKSAALQAIAKINATSGGKSEAAKRAALIAATLNLKQSMVTTTTRNDNTQYEAELEINDYPQQARWKVTHKDALNSITEFTGCAITTRGTFVSAGRKPPPGERKLYLFIEGKSEDDVLTARKEVKRILEETTALCRPEMLSGGRYSFDFH